MRLTLTKIAATTLLGIVFLLGGMGVARAEPTGNAGADAVAGANSGTGTTADSGWDNNTAASGLGPVVNTGTNATGAGTVNPAVNPAGNGTSIQGNEATDKVRKGLNCGVLGTSSITDCFPVAVYGLLYKPASWLLVGSGYIFDKVLMLSIDDSHHMVVPAFIDSSWTVVRDFSNMFFIFILLYTGIMTMFGAKDWRKTILWVVVMALLINFSLFFTKVVIDAGNVLAVGIRSSIAGPEQSISQGLVGAFQPQSFLSAAGKVDPGDATIVFLIATIVSGFAAYVLFKVAILFSRRLIVFWALMILSPFAFMSIALPQKMNKFQEWLKALTSLTFVAPVFLFFIYLIMQVINAPVKILNILITKSGDWFTDLLGPVIVAALLIKALQEVLKFTEDFAGSTGEGFSKLVGGAMGLAGGAAIGVTALGGRAVGGRIAQNLQDKGTFQKMATGNTMMGRFAGRQLLGLNEKARTGTWDARGAGLVQKGLKATGADVGKVSANAKGGFEGAQKRQAEEDAKFVKKLKVTDEEKAAKAAELEPGYKNAVASRTGRYKEEPIARKAKVEAQKQADSSPEGIRVNSAKETLKKQEELIKKDTVDNAKKIADLEKQKSESALPESKAVIQKQIEDIQKSTLDAEKVRDSAKEELQSALGALATTAQGKALSKTTEDLSAIENQIKEATAIIDRGDTAAKDWATEENKTRRGVQANYIEGKSRTGVQWATGNATYSPAQAQRTADKIRKGSTEKDEEEEKKEKDLSKLAKAVAEKQKETEKKDEKPETKPAGEPKH